jgi:hypothetical protein
MPEGFQGIAASTINLARFVKSSGNDHEFAQAGDNDPIVGISGIGSARPPIPDVATHVAAEAGQSFRIHQEGERCLLTAGQPFSAGARLKSDANGKGVAIATSGTTPQRYGAVALQAATAADQLVEVVVVLGVESPA